MSTHAAGFFFSGEFRLPAGLALNSSSNNATSHCLSQTAYLAAAITAGGLIRKAVCEMCSYKTPSLRTSALIDYFFLCKHLQSCAQDVLWLNSLIVYACGLVVGKLNSSVVGGRDAGVAPHCWREGERLRQTQQRGRGNEAAETK